MESKFKCTDCGGDATVAITKWRDLVNKKSYYKKGERCCMTCHKKRTGIKFFN